MGAASRNDKEEPFVLQSSFLLTKEQQRSGEEIKTAPKDIL